MKSSAKRLLLAGVGIAALAAVSIRASSQATFAACSQGCFETTKGCVNFN